MQANPISHRVYLFIYPLARREAPAEGEGANLDRHLVPYLVQQGESNLTSSLSPRSAPTAGLRPAGEGANIDRRLVPYTRDAM